MACLENYPSLESRLIFNSKYGKAHCEKRFQTSDCHDLLLLSRRKFFFRMFIVNIVCVCVNSIAKPTLFNGYAEEYSNQIQEPVPWGRHGMTTIYIF